MTGNFGMNDSKTSSIGFAEKGKSAIDNERERLIDFCQKAYGKEFANRVDAFVPFIELSDENLVKITEMRLSEFAERVNHKNIKINVGPKVAPVIVGDQGSNHGMNAMAINRAISKKVQPLVADAILDLDDLDSYNYTLTVNANKSGELTINKRKRKK
jgi:ATP-dependent Clp protease ATP-binding subunit ClpA